jgi:hypothetical protein
MGKAKSASFLMLLVLGLVFLSQSFRVQAQDASSGPVVRIDPQQTASLDINDNFTVYVWVDNAVAVEAAQVQFTYDPTMLNVTQVLEGPFLPSAGPTATAQLMAVENFDVHPPTGEVYYSSAIVSGAVASGTGVLLNVTFRVVSGGGSPLHLVSYSAGTGGSGTYFLDINFAEMIPARLEHGFYGSSITLSAKPEVINSGEKITLSGSLSGPAAATLSSVSIEYNKDGGAWATLATVPTNGSGIFSYQWTGAETAEFTEFEFRISYQLEGKIYYGPIAIVAVEAVPPSLLGYVYVALAILIAVIVAIPVVSFIRKRRRPEELPEIV